MQAALVRAVAAVAASSLSAAALVDPSLRHDSAVEVELQESSEAAQRAAALSSAGDSPERRSRSPTARRPLGTCYGSVLECPYPARSVAFGLRAPTATARKFSPTRRRCGTGAARRTRSVVLRACAPATERRCRGPADVLCRRSEAPPLPAWVLMCVPSASCPLLLGIWQREDWLVPREGGGVWRRGSRVRPVQRGASTHE